MTSAPHHSKTKGFIGTILLTLLTLTACAPPLPVVERNSTGDMIPQENLKIHHVSKWSDWGKGLEIVDDTHLRFTFQSSELSACERYAAEVVETPETIIVTLSFGELADAKKLCSSEDTLRNMSSSEDSIMVETETPINGRQIIDGGKS